MVFYQLLHLNPDAYEMDLGCYSSMREVEKAKAFLNRQDGFRDLPDNYLVVKRSSPCAHRYQPFYEVTLRYFPVDCSEEYKVSLGFFEKKRSAEKALASFRARNASGKNREICEAEIIKRKLDMILMTDGYDLEDGDQDADTV